MMFCVVLILAFACVDGMPDGSCTQNGKTYSNNEVIDSNPCQPSTCINGHVAQLIVDCINAPCVDYVVKPGECCASCPNGPNCRLPDETLLPGDETKTLDDGSVCSCTSSYGFGIGPSNPDALCAKIVKIDLH